MPKMPLYTSFHHYAHHCTHVSNLLKVFLVLCSVVVVFNMFSVISITSLSTPGKHAFVTVFSANHLCEAMHACQTYSNVPEIKTGMVTVIAFYAEDVTSEMLSNYTKLCPVVQLRPISLKQYPSYVLDLKNYRFKFLILKEVLSEFDTLLYGDVSIWFNTSVTDESLTDLFKSMKTTFAKQGIRMFAFAPHSNFAVTHPLMYNYFNVSVEQMKNTTQLGATALMVSNTTAAHDVIDKVAECALEENCMAPKGAKLKCPYPDFTLNTKVVCHRFDQSAVNMRLIELYGTDSFLYYKPSRLIKLVRTEVCSFP
uniref:Nucleotid_trans domain-containing protein n=1 Tax=Panagrellus redivivus TaxID=6233 RepID=A0A7E4UY97_PANRE